MFHVLREKERAIRKEYEQQRKEEEHAHQERRLSLHRLFSSQRTNSSISHDGDYDDVRRRVKAVVASRVSNPSNFKESRVGKTILAPQLFCTIKKDELTFNGSPRLNVACQIAREMGFLCSVECPRAEGWKFDDFVRIGLPPEGEERDE